MSFTEIGIQPYWSEDDRSYSNEDLKSHYKVVQRILSKQTKMFTLIQAGAVSAPLTMKIRCSKSAIELQESSWKFADRYAVNTSYEIQIENS